MTNCFGKRNCMQLVRSSACAQGAPIFFLLSLGGEEGFFYHFPSFLICSFQVHNRFSSRSQIVPPCSTYVPWNVLITPFIYPICFGKCCAPLSYIDRAKGKICEWNSSHWHPAANLTLTIVAHEDFRVRVVDRRGDNCEPHPYWFSKAVEFKRLSIGVLLA